MRPEKGEKGSDTILVSEPIGPLEHRGQRKVLALERDREVLAEDAIDGGGLCYHRQNAHFRGLLFMRKNTGTSTIPVVRTAENVGCACQHPSRTSGHKYRFQLK